MDTDDAHRSFINLLSKISVGRGGVGAGGTGSVVLSSSRPAPYVPEDLVAQAQSVLQGNLLIFFNSLNTNRQKSSSKLFIFCEILPFLYNTDQHISTLGRSRNLIIRELQRTNLDVNLAVNNLLSRDEEDGDDADDAQDNYVPEVIIYQALVCQHY